MNVFLDLVPVNAFRRRKFRVGGKFFLILSGISISTAGGEEAPHRGVTIEPIYTPILTIDRRGSLVYIEIAWGKRRLLIVVSPTKPFLYVERTDRILLEDEE